VAQDRLLQAMQLRRGFESQLLVQPHAAACVDLQRVGLAAAPIQRPHQQTDQPLARRMLGGQLLELGNDECVLSRRQTRVDALFQSRNAQLLEPRDLSLRERLESDVGQCGSTPQPQRVVEQTPRRRRIAPHARGPRRGHERLEAPRVYRVGLDHKAISRRHRLDRRAGRCDRAPQSRHRHLQAAQRLRRGRPRPQRLGGSVG